jgi:hypothetical protein
MVTQKNEDVKKLVDGDEARKPENQELSTMPSN